MPPVINTTGEKKITNMAYNLRSKIKEIISGLSPNKKRRAQSDIREATKEDASEIESQSEEETSPKTRRIAISTSESDGNYRVDTDTAPDDLVPPNLPVGYLFHRPPPHLDPTFPPLEHPQPLRTQPNPQLDTPRHPTTLAIRPRHELDFKHDIFERTPSPLEIQSTPEIESTPEIQSTPELQSPPGSISPQFDQPPPAAQSPPEVQSPPRSLSPPLDQPPLVVPSPPPPSPLPAPQTELNELRQLERQNADRINELQNELDETRDQAILAQAQLTPTQFHGTGHESARRFIDKFKTIANALGWDDDKLLRMTPLYLAGIAELWYRGLEVKPQTFDEFETQLNNQFKNPALRLVGKQEFHRMTQGEKESVDEYTQRITKLADKNDIQPDDTRDQFLIGLRTDIKKQVYPFQPKTIQAAVKTAQLAETAMIPELSNHNREAELRQQIVDLKRRITKRTPSNIEPLKGKIYCDLCQAPGHFPGQCTLSKTMSKEYAYPLNEHRG